MINPYDVTVTRYVKVQTAVNLLVYLNSLEWWAVPHGETLFEKLRADVRELLDYLREQNRAALEDVPLQTILRAGEGSHD